MLQLTDINNRWPFIMFWRVLVMWILQFAPLRIGPLKHSFVYNFRVKDMKVFKFNRICFTILGVYPFIRIKREYRELVQNCSFYFVFATLAVYLCVHVAFIHQNFHHLSQLPDLILAFAAIVFWFAINGSYIGSIIGKKKALDDLSNELQAIVDKGNLFNEKLMKSEFLMKFSAVKKTEEFRIYRKTERRCRLILVWAFIVSFANCAFLGIFPSVVHSIVSMVSGNFDTSTWFFVLKIAVPFNTSTIFGWYMKLLLELLFAIVAISIITPIVTYLANCCLYVFLVSNYQFRAVNCITFRYVRALCDHFKVSFQKIDNRIIFDFFGLIMSKTENEFKELISFHMQITKWV